MMPRATLIDLSSGIQEGHLIVYLAGIATDCAPSLGYVVTVELTQCDQTNIQFLRALVSLRGMWGRQALNKEGYGRKSPLCLQLNRASLRFFPHQKQWLRSISTQIFSGFLKRTTLLFHVQELSTVSPEPVQGSIWVILPCVAFLASDIP